MKLLKSHEGDGGMKVKIKMFLFFCMKKKKYNTYNIKYKILFKI